jgi:rhodanese-related sulfurtransferase
VATPEPQSVDDDALAEPFARISPEEAWRLVREAGAAVVDVRRPGEYRAAHIAGSLNIDVDDLFTRRAEVPLDRDVVVVCRVGVVSVLGAEILALLGGDRVHNLEGGIQEWVRRGLPLEVDSSRPLG